MKKTEIIVITLTSIVILGGIVCAGVDAYRHPSEAITPELREDEEFYYSINENGNVETIPKSDTITVPTGYAVVEAGHIVEFIPAD